MCCMFRKASSDGQLCQWWTVPGPTADAPLGRDQPDLAVGDRRCSGRHGRAAQAVSGHGLPGLGHQARPDCGLLSWPGVQQPGHHAGGCDAQRAGDAPRDTQPAADGAACAQGAVAAGGPTVAAHGSMAVGNAAKACRCAPLARVQRHPGRLQGHRWQVRSGAGQWLRTGLPGHGPGIACGSRAPIQQLLR